MLHSHLKGVGDRSDGDSDGGGGARGGAAVLVAALALDLLALALLRIDGRHCGGWVFRVVSNLAPCGESGLKHAANKQHMHTHVALAPVHTQQSNQQPAGC